MSDALKQLAIATLGATTYEILDQGVGRIYVLRRTSGSGEVREIPFPVELIDELAVRRAIDAFAALLKR